MSRILIICFMLIVAFGYAGFVLENVTIQQLAANPAGAIFVFMPTWVLIFLTFITIWEAK